MVKSNDKTFLADELAPRKTKLGVTYIDGFRFGFGAAIGVMFVSLIVGVLSWGIILVFNLH